MPSIWLILGYIFLFVGLVWFGNRASLRHNDGGILFGACVLAFLLAIPYWAIAGDVNVGMHTALAGFAIFCIMIILAPVIAEGPGG